MGLVAFVMLVAGVVGQVELQLSCARSLKLLLLLSCKCQLTSLQHEQLTFKLAGGMSVSLLHAARIDFKGAFKRQAASINV